MGRLVKVIFLDFDGVVCTVTKEWTTLPDGRNVQVLNGAAVARLNEIYQRTGAYVVVSSTWRLGTPVELLAVHLTRYGFRGLVLGATPDLHPRGERGHEIAAWLRAHPKVTSYVVLDDDADRGPIPAERWVLVKGGWSNGGLQAQHVEAAISALAIPAERVA